MKKELPYFNIGASYGGNQEWFSSFMMRLGGCAAETACELCIFADLYRGTNLYPFDVHHLTREEYVRFADVMKPYLHPRMSGIDRLSIYLDGFGQYLKDCGSAMTLRGIEGSETPSADAARALTAQIDSGMPAAFLCLNHTDRRFKEYEWHWFIINGYDARDDGLYVKAVTYSVFEWLPFEDLWNSGRVHRGGMVMMSEPPEYAE